MNCPLKKLLMEMDFNTSNVPQNQVNKIALDINVNMRKDAVIPQRKECPDDENKGPVVANCIDGESCCVLLLSRYFVAMREEDVEEFRNKLRKLV